MPQHHDATQIRLKDLTALRQQAESFLLPDSGKKAMTGIGGTYSPFKSRGLDFQEVRVYQPGDDIRQIDWHITAKYGKPFTKLYTEEKERTIFFIIDMRANMNFATHGDFKSVVAARIAAFIAFIAEHQKDKIGYIILTDEGLLFSGDAETNTVSALLNTLVHPHTGKTKSSWAYAVRLLGQFLPAGSFVFLLSDFYDWKESDTTLLAPLSDKNTFVFCTIYDRLEAELPSGFLPFSNGTTTIVVNAQSEKIRKKFHEEWQHKQDQLKQVTHKYSWGLLPVTTDSDYLNLLTHFCFGRGTHES